MPTNPAEPVTSTVFNPFEDESESKPSRERDDKGRFLPPKPSVSVRLSEQAKQFGLTAEDVAEMSEAEVREHIREAKLDARFNQQLEMVSKLRETRPEPAEPAWNLGIKSVDEDPENGHDSKLVGALNKLVQRIEVLEKGHGETRGYVEAQANRQRESQTKKLDRAFAKHPHIFGAEAADKIDKDSPEFHFRVAAYKAFQKSGADPDEIQAQIDTFVADKFGARKPAPKQEVTEADEDEQDRLYAAGEGVYGRPTSNAIPAPKPSKEAAAAAVKEQLRPMRNGTPQRTSMDEFPKR